MKLSLVVLTEGKQQGKILPITLTQFVIGRDPQCQLRPASPAISKRHCAILQKEGKVFIRDFDSTNGTFVNDQPVKGEIEIKNEDILKVGPLLFGVKIEATTPVNRPTPVPATKAPAPAPKPPASTPAPPTKKEPPKTVVAAEGATDDDSIAAMLLSLQDDSEAGTGLAGEVPEGSTVMDIGIVPPGKEGAGATKKEEPPKPTAPPPNTSNAAKALLEKYMKRPR